MIVFLASMMLNKNSHLELLVLGGELQTLVVLATRLLDVGLEELDGRVE
jgi:hypothetical protein